MNIFYKIIIRHEIKAMAKWHSEAVCSEAVATWIADKYPLFFRNRRYAAKLVAQYEKEYLNFSFRNSDKRNSVVWVLGAIDEYNYSVEYTEVPFLDPETLDMLLAQRKRDSKKEYNEALDRKLEKRLEEIFTDKYTKFAPIYKFGYNFGQVPIREWFEEED